MLSLSGELPIINVGLLKDIVFLSQIIMFNLLLVFVCFFSFFFLFVFFNCFGHFAILYMVMKGRFVSLIGSVQMEPRCCLQG